MNAALFELRRAMQSLQGALDKNRESDFCVHCSSQKRHEKWAFFRPITQTQKILFKASDFFTGTASQISPLKKREFKKCILTVGHFTKFTTFDTISGPLLRSADFLAHFRMIGLLKNTRLSLVSPNCLEPKSLF